MVVVGAVVESPRVAFRPARRQRDGGAHGSIVSVSVVWL